MKEEYIELAKYRLEKARNTLADAKNYFQGATLESNKLNPREFISVYSRAFAVD